MLRFCLRDRNTNWFLVAYVTKAGAAVWRKSHTLDLTREGKYKKRKIAL
jgi:hypothetical protein